MGLFNIVKSRRTVLIVDGVSLNESFGFRGKIAPRNQLQLLRRVSRFAQREKLEVVIVLSGPPLHKAPPRKKFEDILVLYSKSPESHTAYLAKTARSRGSKVILICGAEAEKAAGRSVCTMRMSTFRKVFDSNIGDSEPAERESGGRGGRKRPSRRRQPKPVSENKPRNEAPSPASESDSINELIDLID